MIIAIYNQSLLTYNTLLPILGFYPHNFFNWFLYICFMESLLIHPESAEQLRTVKAVLKALKVQFEPQSTKLPVHVLKGIDKSLQQFAEGNSISLEDFSEKHLK